MAKTRTESAFMKFLHATIEALPDELLDELLETTPIKSLKASPAIIHFVPFFSACHHFPYVGMM